jgi:hypothetical protein
VLAAEGTEGGGHGGTVRSLDEGAPKAVTGINRKAKRRVRVRVQGNNDSRRGQEGARRDIKIREGKVKVKNIEVVIAETVEEARIRRLVVNIMHGFIEGNVLSRLDSFGDRIIVEDILERFGVAKEDAGAGIGDELIRTTGTGRKSIDTTTKHAKEMEVRLFTSTHFVG